MPSSGKYCLQKVDLKKDLYLNEQKKNFCCSTGGRENTSIVSVVVVIEIKTCNTFPLAKKLNALALIQKGLHCHQLVMCF